MTAPEDDQDVWGLYARGVKRLGEKEPEPAKAKSPVSSLPQAPPQATEKNDAIAFVELMGGGAQKSIMPLRGHKEAGSSPPLSPKGFGACDDEEEGKRLASSLPPSRWKKEPLDLRIERNMSLGDVFIEAKLDLHGQTEAAAHTALKDFIETQSKNGKRMLLVITGKGAGGASVLRANLPRWCDVPPFDGLVLAVRTAAQHHGGDGAYYVLLRKRGP